MFKSFSKLCKYASFNKNIKTLMTFYPTDSPIPIEPIIKVESVSKKHFTEKRSYILKNISFNCFEGSKIGIVGMNGSGKSSLLNILSGIDDNFNGSVLVNKKLSIGFLEQEPKFDVMKTVDYNIKKALSYQFKLLSNFERISDKFNEDDANFDKLLIEQGEIQEEIEELDCWNLNKSIETFMKSLNCPHPHKLIKDLSGGEKRRVALCRLLISKPDILFLDEPTNHLDMDTINWMEQFLKSYKGTTFIISHDRYFLDKNVEYIMELDNGICYSYIGNYSNWIKQKMKGKENIKNKSKENNKITKEIKKLKSSRRNKVKQKRLEELNNIEKEDDKSEFITRLLIPKGPHLSNPVIDIRNIYLKFGEKVIFDNVTMSFVKKSIVGIIGPNGSGKTSFFRIIVNEIKADEGTINVNDGVKFGYITQNRENINEKNVVWREICGNDDIITISEKLEMNPRQYVAQFNFKGINQEKFVNSLSGGEKNRLLLAKILKKGCNVLLLDEPSNDLDVFTLTALENSINEFEGCVLCISHDRYFLNRICTNILEFDGSGNVNLINGNYKDYLRCKKMMNNHKS